MGVGDIGVEYKSDDGLSGCYPESGRIAQLSILISDGAKIHLSTFPEKNPYISKRSWDICLYSKPCILDFLTVYKIQCIIQ